jgi:hypothetical protein
VAAVQDCAINKSFLFNCGSSVAVRWRIARFARHVAVRDARCRRRSLADRLPRLPPISIGSMRAENSLVIRAAARQNRLLSTADDTRE